MISSHRLNANVRRVNSSFSEERLKEEKFIRESPISMIIKFLDSNNVQKSLASKNISQASPVQDYAFPQNSLNVCFGIKLVAEDVTGRCKTVCSV